MKYKICFEKSAYKQLSKININQDQVHDLQDGANPLHAGSWPHGDAGPKAGPSDGGERRMEKLRFRLRMNGDQRHLRIDEQGQQHVQAIHHQVGVEDRKSTRLTQIGRAHV